MIKSNLRTLVILIIGIVVASFYACSKDSYQTALTTSEDSSLLLRGGEDTCKGPKHPHDSLWLGGHHPHDSLWTGWNHPHDSTKIIGPHHPHDSLWIINHPKDTTGIGGGPKGGGHHGGGNNGGGNGGHHKGH